MIGYDDAAMVVVGDVFEPRSAYVERYDEQYAFYRRLYPALRETFHDLTRHATNRVLRRMT